MKTISFAKNRKRVLSALLICVLSVLSVTSVGADTSTDIQNTRAAQDATQEQLDQANSQIAVMEGEKSDLETYLADLNVQLTELSDTLTALGTQIEDKNVEIEMARAAYERATLAVDQQYEDMQVRIQYMYENGTGLLQTLCSTSSLTDFLNRADEISQIQSYDRDCLEDYKETCRDVKAREEELVAEEAELQNLKTEQENKQAEVQELASTTDAKIAEYTASINMKADEAAGLRSEIEAQKQKLAELEAQAAAEEEARRKAAEEEARLAELAAKKASEEAAAAEETAKSESSTKAPAEESNSSASETTASGKYLGRFKLTAYCPCAKCCGQWAGGGTASGTKPVEGRTVAMAGVPFGTKLLINGTVYTVEDRGTSYGHVDIFMNSHSACLQFGLKYADVYLVS